MRRLVAGGLAALMIAGLAIVAVAPAASAGPVGDRFYAPDTVSDAADCPDGVLLEGFGGELYCHPPSDYVPVDSRADCEEAMGPVFADAVWPVFGICAILGGPVPEEGCPEEAPMLSEEGDVICVAQLYRLDTYSPSVSGIESTVLGQAQPRRAATSRVLPAGTAETEPLHVGIAALSITLGLGGLIALRASNRRH